MASTTGWVAGRLAASWTPIFTPSTDLVVSGTGLPTGYSVLSSSADINNAAAGTYDMYADISVRVSLGSSQTIPVGAYLSVYLVPLLEGGTGAYGDGTFAAGVQKAGYPFYPPVGTLPIINNPNQTVLAGLIQAVLLPPGIFRFLFFQNSSFSLSTTAANHSIAWRTYNVNLNV